MSKIEKVDYAESCELSQYDEILYNLNFIEDVLEVKPEKVCYFAILDIEPKKLKEKVLEKMKSAISILME